MSFRRKSNNKKDESTKIDYTQTFWKMPELEPLPKLPPKPPPSPPPPPQSKQRAKAKPQPAAAPKMASLNKKADSQSKKPPPNLKSLNPFDNNHEETVASAAQKAKQKQQEEEQQKRHELALEKQRQSLTLQKQRECTYTQVQNQLSETVQTSHATCTMLDSQKEQLVHTATLVEHTGDVVNQSKRLLRGMTWGGWVQNKFSNNEGSSSNASLGSSGSAGASSVRNLSSSIGPGGLAASASASSSAGPPNLFASFRKNTPPPIPPSKLDYQKYLSAPPNPSTPHSQAILITAISHCFHYRNYMERKLCVCSTIPELTNASKECKGIKKEVWDTLKQYQQLKSFATEKREKEGTKMTRQEIREDQTRQKLYKDIIKEVDSLELTQVKMEKYVRGNVLKKGGHSSPALIQKTMKEKAEVALANKNGVENVPGPTRKSFSNAAASGTTTAAKVGGNGSFTLQEIEQQIPHSSEPPPPKPNKHTTNRTELFSNLTSKPQTEQLLDQNLLTEQALQKQDDHLSVLSAGLTELQNVNTTINTSIKEQNEMLDRIGEDADLYRHDMKVLVRKADRMRNGMSWSLTASRPYFQYNVALRHIPTGKYLTTTTTTNNKNRGILYLSSTCHPFGSVFELHKKGNETNKKKPVSSSISKRSLKGDGGGGGGGDASSASTTTTTTEDFGGQGSIVGFKNKRSGKWLGLAFWSGGKKNIVCYADRFGRREEWELEEGEGLKKARDKGKINIQQTENSSIVTLINASANFGNGGYLETKGLKKQDGDIDVSLTIGVAEVSGKKTAALWAIEKRDDAMNDETAVTASRN